MHYAKIKLSRVVYIAGNLEGKIRELAAGKWSLISVMMAPLSEYLKYKDRDRSFCRVYLHGH